MLLQGINLLSVVSREVPNILNPKGVPASKHVELDVEQLNKDASARLALIGGMPGLLSHMRKDGVSTRVCLA